MQDALMLSAALCQAERDKSSLQAQLWQAQSQLEAQDNDLHIMMQTAQQVTIPRSLLACTSVATECQHHTCLSLLPLPEQATML